MSTYTYTYYITIKKHICTKYVLTSISGTAAQTAISAVRTCWDFLRPATSGHAILQTLPFLLPE